MVLQSILIKLLVVIKEEISMWGAQWVGRKWECSPRGCWAAYLHPQMDVGPGWTCGPQSSSMRAGVASASPALTKRQLSNGLTHQH